VVVKKRDEYKPGDILINRSGSKIVILSEAKNFPCPWHVFVHRGYEVRDLRFAGSHMNPVGTWCCALLGNYKKAISAVEYWKELNQ